MYVSICVHSNPYYVASCSPRPSFSATMTDAGTHALLKKWADAVALRTVHRGVYSPDSTRTVSWPSLENCAWSTFDTPVALVKLTHPRVAQPHSLTDPLLSLFDNNPNLQAIVLQLHDSDALGCSVLGRGAEPLVRTQFLEHPPTLNFGANHLKKWIQHPQKPPIPFLSPHNPHRRGGFRGGGQTVRAQLEQS